MTVVIETKQIKPQRLRVSEIRLSLLNELRKQGTAIRKEYAKTVATWRKKPKFVQEISTTGGEFTVLVGTDDAVYGYVDLGTRPHRIKARNKPFLLYQGTFTPKTLPGVIGSKAGGKSGSWVKRREVQHPGNQPRRFSQIIQKRRRQPFHRAMVAAMKRGAVKANARGQA